MTGLKDMHVSILLYWRLPQAFARPVVSYWGCKNTDIAGETTKMS